MDSILDSLKEYLGIPDFYRVLESGRSASWDYGAMLEYAIAGMLLVVVVSNVFKLIRGFFS